MVPFTGERKELSKRIIVGLVMAISLTSTMFAASAAATGNEISAKNQSSYWCESEGQKIEEGFSGDSWVADDSYALVVLKSARVNDEFHNVVVGQKVATVSGKDISHIILCDPIIPPTTETQPTTTTVKRHSTTTTTPSTTVPTTTQVPTTTVVIPPEIPQVPTPVPVPYTPNFTG